MAGRNRKVLYISKKKAGHNGEISCKSGTFEKISSIENRRVKKSGRPAKNGTVGKYDYSVKVSMTTPKSSATANT